MTYIPAGEPQNEAPDNLPLGTHSHTGVVIGGKRFSLASFMGQLKAISIRRGYKRGWASHKFKEATDVWPNGEILRVPDQPTTEEVLRWVQGSHARSGREKPPTKPFNPALPVNGAIVAERPKMDLPPEENTSSSTPVTNESDMDPERARAVKWLDTMVLRGGQTGLYGLPGALSPAIAQVLMSRNAENRPINKNNEKYLGMLRDIRAGEWDRYGSP